MFGMNDFGMSAAWSPGLFFAVAMLAVLYILAVGSYRTTRFKRSEPVGKWKWISMLSGLGLYYLSQGGPLDLAGHLTFSAHMVSMSVAYLIVPPLIIYGIPDWLYRYALRNATVKRIFDTLTQPILTLVLFNMLFSMYHFPDVLDYVMTHYFVHTVYYAVLLVTAFMMWWNVVSPLPEHERLTDVKKMGYVFANGVLLTPACALIIFAGSPLYGTYSDPAIWAKALGYCVPASADAILAQFNGPGTFALFEPLEDQQLGGVIMKLMQEVMYGAILFYIFLRWYKRENPSGVIDPIDSAPTLK